MEAAPKYAMSPPCLQNKIKNILKLCPELASGAKFEALPITSIWTVVDSDFYCENPEVTMNGVKCDLK